MYLLSLGTWEQREVLWASSAFHEMALILQGLWAISIHDSEEYWVLARILMFLRAFATTFSQLALRLVACSSQCPGLPLFHQFSLQSHIHHWYLWVLLEAYIWHVDYGPLGPLSLLE